MESNHPKRLIVGISGASGAIYGVRLIEKLSETDIETHVVISESARITLATETDYSIDYLQDLAYQVHHSKNIGASISSGSFETLGMIIAPCSIRSMSEIATGVTSSLLTRAADVVLKERRRLVLLVRETPLHTGHLRTLVNLSEIGAIVMPPVPAFYQKPETIDDIINHTVGRCLDLFGIKDSSIKRWQGLAHK